MNEVQTTHYLSNHLLAEMERAPSGPDVIILLNEVWRLRLMEIELHNYLQQLPIQSTADSTALNGNSLAHLRMSLGYASIKGEGIASKRKAPGVWTAFREYTPDHNFAEVTKQRLLRPSEWIEIAQAQKKTHF